MSSSDIRPILFTDPIHVYTLSLESAVAHLAAGRHGSDRQSSGGHAGNETRVFEERGGMVELIVEAMEELRSCGEDLKEKSESTAVGDAGTRVRDIELLLRYSRDYLLKCDFVNRRFRFQTFIIEKESRNPFSEILSKSSVFGLQ